ncbi:MAG TPA: cytochrome c oxidase subunit 3 [Caulobacteraceae bacterium]|jgi:heme/copper-type cytochrome/quinol oxidase subunit 3
MISAKVIGDLSGLPEHGFGPRTIMWWGVLGFMLLEGSGFLLAGGAYLFVSGQYSTWPPAGTNPPDHLWGALFTVLILVSVIPNMLAERAARREDKGGTRLWLIVLTTLTVALIVVRFIEMQHLNVRWDANAYGSVVWALIFLHLFHILTDFGDTLGLAIFAHTHKFDRGRYSDVTDNCMYWNFVVLTWLPIYGLVYWSPRLF